MQIGGPAGAFIVIVYGIVERYGLANLLIATSLAGVLLFLMGLFKLGALVRYIPVSIVIGFTNGIAVLIALSQVKDLLGLEIDKMPADFFTQIGVLAQHLDTLQPGGVGASALACLAAGGAVAQVATPCRRRRWARLAKAAALGGAPAGHHRRAGRRHAGHRAAEPAGGDHRLALRRHPAGAAGASRCPSSAGPRAKQLLIPTHHHRAAGRHRVAAVRARGRQHDRAAAPRPEPGADGAGRGQLRDAVLRRHPGHRHHRPHRDQRARRRRHARWPASCTR